MSEPITCTCGFEIWNGEVVRSRVLKIRPEDGYFAAKCRCKRWLVLPVRYMPDRPSNSQPNPTTP